MEHEWTKYEEDVLAGNAYNLGSLKGKMLFLTDEDVKYLVDYHPYVRTERSILLQLDKLIPFAVVS